MANVHTRTKSGFIRRNGVMRRESVWVALTPTITTLAASSTPVLFTGYSAAVLAMIPFTIVRTRGYMALRSDQEGADENFSCALAMAIVSIQALAIGVTAVPTADSDRDSDLFFLFEELAGSFIFVAGLAAQSNAISGSFDSRAMRKVEDGQDIAVTIEGTAVSAGQIVYKGGRQLIKLH